MKKGYSVIEAILVLAIVGILTTSLAVIIQPNKHMAKARDTQRKTDVRVILSGLYQYAADHGGSFPSCVTASVQNICISTDCSGVHLGCSLHPIVGQYIVSIPVDPSGATGNDTNYDVQQREDGRIIVSAPKAERQQKIRVAK